MKKKITNSQLQYSVNLLHLVSSIKSLLNKKTKIVSNLVKIHCYNEKNKDDDFKNLMITIKDSAKEINSITNFLFNFINAKELSEVNIITNYDFQQIIKIFYSAFKLKILLKESDLTQNVNNIYWYCMCLNELYLLLIVILNDIIYEIVINKHYCIENQNNKPKKISRKYNVDLFSLFDTSNQIIKKFQNNFLKIDNVDDKQILMQGEDYNHIVQSLINYEMLIKETIVSKKVLNIYFYYNIESYIDLIKDKLDVIDEKSFKMNYFALKQLESCLFLLSTTKLIDILYKRFNK